MDHGEPKTPFMSFGDSVTMEVYDEVAGTVFGKIHQRVVQA